MDFYDSIKLAFSEADAIMGATNSSFKIYEDFYRGIYKEGYIFVILDVIYFSDEENCLIIEYTPLDKEGMLHVGLGGNLIFDSDKKEWAREIKKISIGWGKERPEIKQTLWELGVQNKIRDEKWLRELMIDVYKGYLSYPNGEEKTTVQSQYLLDIEFIQEMTHEPHFVRFFLKKGTYYPTYVLGYENLYYLYKEMDDGSNTIIATISCGIDTDRIYSHGLEIVPYNN